MIIQVAKDVFLNPNQIILFRDINNYSSPVVFITNKQGVETEYFVDKKRLREILDKFPNFLSVGNDFVNVDEIVFIKNEQDLIIELSDGAEYVYDENELSLTNRDKFLELFKVENVYSEDDELLNDELGEYERMLDDEEDDGESF